MDKYAQDESFSKRKITKQDLIEKHVKKLEMGLLKSETSNYLYFFDVFLRDILEYNREENVLFDETVDKGAKRSEFVLKKGDEKFMIVELKGQNVDLDKPQKGHNNQTPVEQAREYSLKTKSANWIMVSNYDEFRLYHWSKKEDYISFKAEELLDDKKFKYFMLAFSKKSHITEKYVDKLLKKSLVVENDIEKDFYKLFHETRLMLIKELEDINGFETPKAVHYAQAILNRYMFICFAEDINNLLPSEISTETIYVPIKERNIDERIIWNRLNELFGFINKGNEYKGINGYNGGLFREDFSFITIRDIVEDPNYFKDQRQKWKLNEYSLKITELMGPYGKKINPIYWNLLTISSINFESDLDVNILGHIFENSIGDLEDLREGSKGRRKKDGIFYTPNYITEYICKNTIIPYLSKSGTKTEVKDLIREYWGSEIHQLDEKVKKIKIVDPACGSGAFLNKAADILLEIHEEIHKRLYKDDPTFKRFYDTVKERRRILKNNIYGVDLNEESVEITKLGMFLKVAQKDVKLPDLDKNIKCGNSLIDDSDYAGEKAFNWEKEFPEIFEDGGFDIVIGNPPYINVRSFGANSLELEYIKNHYSKVWMDKSDILFYFISKAIEISKHYVTFIVSNAFLFAEKGHNLRNFILENAPISRIVNFEKYQVFNDANITTAIVTFNKSQKNWNTEAISLKKSTYSENQLLKLINEPNNFFNVELKKDSVFALITPDIIELNKKIDGKHPKLGGLVFVGKGMETAANKVFAFKEIPSNFPKMFVKKRLNGDIVNRYRIDKGNEYLLYVEDVNNFEELPEEIKTHLLENKETLEKRFTVKNEGRPWWKYSRAVHKKYYCFDKIWCSYRSRENQFAIDENDEYIGLTNTSVIFGNNKDISLKYILALINSKLINFRYKSIGKQTGGGLYEYFEYQIRKIPIPNIDLNNQKAFIKNADLMIQLNKDLQDEIRSFHTWLQRTFNMEKLSNKLEKYYELNFEEFLKEVKKKKVDIKPRKTQELLENEFNESLAVIKPLLHEIEVIDREIDEMVYDLYGLTSEEKQIVEDSLK
jgi:hypothetical protein